MYLVDYESIISYIYLVRVSYVGVFHAPTSSLRGTYNNVMLKVGYFHSSLLNGSILMSMDDTIHVKYNG